MFPSSKRKNGLDFLRGIAILLVLFRHSDYTNFFLFHFGWLGVDLFFVLSGFLITNILIQQQTLPLKTFYYHRFLKIVPPFYLFLIISSIYSVYYLDTNFSYKKIISELLFTQSYGPHIWLHTWTLAVEVQFYLFIGLLFYLIHSFKLKIKLKPMLIFIGIILISSLLFRILNSYPHRNEYSFFFTQTHLRCDGLFVGMLFSFLKEIPKTNDLLNRFRFYLLFLGLLLIAPGFRAYGGGFFMNTIGLSLVNLGFGCIVYFSYQSEHLFQSENSLKAASIRLFCFIGISSYSIYLWHMLIKKVLTNILGFNENTWVYFLLSLFIGMFFYLAIEKPLIKVKNLVILKQS